jgi:hypothetical protein
VIVEKRVKLQCDWLAGIVCVGVALKHQFNFIIAKR